MRKNELFLPPDMRTIKKCLDTGLSYDALRKMCLRGEIAHVRCGNKFLINYGALCEYLSKAGVREDAQ
jgi:excisionase family DNA binding protein